MGLRGGAEFLLWYGPLELAAELELKGRFFGELERRPTTRRSGFSGVLRVEAAVRTLSATEGAGGFESTEITSVAGSASRADSACSVDRAPTSSERS